MGTRITKGYGPFSLGLFLSGLNVLVLVSTNLSESQPANSLPTMLDTPRTEIRRLALPAVICKTCVPILGIKKQ